MAVSPIDIERVVREVLAELGLAPMPASPQPQVGPPSPQAPAQPAKPARPTKPARPNGELTVSERVVSLAALERRLDGVRSLVVPARAVVTPSVRDELRRRDIRLVRGEAEAQSAGDTQSPMADRSGGARLSMFVAGSRFDPNSLCRALAAEGIAPTIDRADCLIEATDRAAREVAQPDALAVVLTAYPAAAVCLANRHRGVRAVAGFPSASIVSEIESVGANLLVVNPQASGPFQLRRMIGHFAVEGPRTCPEVFCERLGPVGK